MNRRSSGSLDLDYTKRLARAHEDNGWDRILVAYHSGSPDPAAVAAYIATQTERVNLVLAKGRFEVHFITGGSTADQAARRRLPGPRYDRTREYIQIVKQAWNRPSGSTTTASTTS